jgi:hypothetical protein
VCVRINLLTDISRLNYALIELDATETRKKQGTNHISMDPPTRDERGTQIEKAAEH